jgi:hypothetical protein
MNDAAEIFLRTILIGVGATVVLDLWSVVAHRLFGFLPVNWAMVGRWVGHFPQGRFMHPNIAKASQVKGELFIGWSFHYAIGIAYAALIMAILGLDWACSPTLAPALIIGISTVVAPFFILQPGMGAGLASSKTPNPNMARLRSILNHSVFGFGLYGAARLSAVVF